MKNISDWCRSFFATKNQTTQHQASVCQQPNVAPLKLIVGVSASLIAMLGIASAQTQRTQGQKAPDVVVIGTPQGPFPTIDENPAQFVEKAVYARQAAADAHFFSRCISERDNRYLHGFVDGPPNRFVRDQALENLVLNHLSCHPGNNARKTGGDQSYGDCNPRGEFRYSASISNAKDISDVFPVNVICQSFFDRGAIVEKVLELYAKDISLTRIVLNEATVVKRLQAREKRLDQYRSKEEQLYTRVVDCMVEDYPDYALKLLQASANSRAEAALRRALIGNSTACVGGATRVDVDPSQFRVFVADAVYSWVLAMRGVDSLIPAAQ